MSQIVHLFAHACRPYLLIGPYVLFAHVHNWPSMIDNDDQQTCYLFCTVYCHCMLCCCRVSNTRLVQMLCTGYVLYGALARGHVLIKGTFSRIADMHESHLASYIEAAAEDGHYNICLK